MSRSASIPQSVPAWVARLGAPVWVSDPLGRVAWINRRAACLLGVRANAVIGSPCHEVIGGVDAEGRPHCGPACAVPDRARRGGELEPIDLRIGAPGGPRHWVQVLIIALPGPARRRPWLVHCAIPRDKSHRIEKYLEKIATRTGGELAAHPSADLSG